MKYDTFDKYVVLDNGKPATLWGIECWETNEFSSFEEALGYATDWLGEWNSLPPDWDGRAYSYSDGGDVIEIIGRREK